MYLQKGEGLPDGRQNGSASEKYPSSVDELRVELLSLMTIIKSRDRNGADADTSESVDRRLDKLLEETLDLFDSKILYSQTSIVHSWTEGLRMFRTLAEGTEVHKAEKRGKRDS